MKKLFAFAAAAAALSAQPAPNPTGITAVFSNGETFVTWSDPLTGAAGQNLRYKLYRSTSGPITNTATATLAQDGLAILNNNGQFNTGVIGQTTRVSQAQAMVNIPGGPSALAPWTGLAVHTAAATESAYYAVVAYDRTNATYTSPSPIVAGQNATAVAVNESPASLSPVLQRGDSFGWGWTGATGMPMYLCLHASSATNPWPYGGSDGIGDLYAFWGDSGMSFQEGVQQQFDVSQTTTLHRSCAPENTGTVTASSLFLQPRDGKYKQTGASEMEDSWFGWMAAPYGGGTSLARNPTERYLSSAIGWSQSHYAADPNRLYCVGGSMGAWGCTSYALHHPEMFAAVFLDRPRWIAPVTLYNVDTDGLVNVTASAPLMADGVTPFQAALNSPAYITAQAAARANIPWVGWGIGRNDQFTGGSNWSQHVNAVAALRAAKAGFAVCWDNGEHGTLVYLNTIQAQYTVKAPTMFARNKSYPAFGNFSLDSNIGNGSSTDGDLTGCINAGFSWDSVSETATTWAASISNSAVTTGTATVDVTPRNTQAFFLGPGRRATWTTSTGQNGTATADAHGLVTASGVQINTGASTIVTFTASRAALFPLPVAVRRR